MGRKTQPSSDGGDRRNPSKIAEVSPDLVEPLLDEAAEELSKGIFGVMMPELAKELPIIKYAVTAKDLYTTWKTHKLQKRMKHFLGSLLTDNFPLTNYLELSNEERQLILDILVTELDLHTDDKQSEALSLLFNAYVKKDVDRLMFHGVSHELKNINPLVFYFSVDSFSLRPTKAGVLIAGPLHYLPATFYSNSSEAILFSSNTYLTNLGKVFFQVIYEPMRTKYEI